MAVDGTEREDFTFEIGTGYDVYKVDDEVLGMKRDETDDREILSRGFRQPSPRGQDRQSLGQANEAQGEKAPGPQRRARSGLSEKYKTLDDLKADLRGHPQEALDAAKSAIRSRTHALVDFRGGDLQDRPAGLDGRPSSSAMRLETLKRQMGVDDGRQARSRCSP